jgi:hypothetical protein
LTTSAAYRANAHKPPAKTNVVLDIKGSVFLTFCLSLFHRRLMTSRSLLPVHPRVHHSDTLTHAQVGRHDGLQEDGGAREGGAEREREREREGGAEREREGGAEREREGEGACEGAARCVWCHVRAACVRRLVVCGLAWAEREGDVRRPRVSCLVDRPRVCSVCCVRVPSREPAFSMELY